MLWLWPNHGFLDAENCMVCASYNVRDEAMSAERLSFFANSLVIGKLRVAFANYKADVLRIA